MISQRKRGFTSAAVIGAWVVLIAALSTVLAGAIFDSGFFERTESFHGSFDKESSETSQCFVVAVGKNSRLRKLLSIVSAAMGPPERRSLRRPHGAVT